jgi:hypothetical protein
MAYGDHCKVDRALVRREVVQAKLGAVEKDLVAFLALATDLRAWADQCAAKGDHATAREIRAGVDRAFAEWAAHFDAD